MLIKGKEDVMIGREEGEGGEGNQQDKERETPNKRRKMGE